MAKTSINLRIDPDLLREADELAKRSGKTRTEIIERSLAAGIREGKEHMDKLDNPVIRSLIEAALKLDPSVSGDDMNVWKDVVAQAKATKPKPKRRK